MQYQKEDIKKRILDAALFEFEKEGYYKASVLRIATRSKVAIGNLYRYFKGKSELFDALVGIAAAEIEGFIRTSYQENIQGLESAGQAEKKLRDGIVYLFETYGREFLLLLDRSQGSAYNEYGVKLCREICHLWKEAFVKGGAEDAFILELIAEGFVGGLIKIFRIAKPEERGEKVDKLFMFYFHNINCRLR